MRAHTITTKARVGARGPTKRTILALSLAVVLLAATASTASADRVLFPWYCPLLPPAPSWSVNDPQLLNCIGGLRQESFDFGDRQVGTTSAAQRFALGVTNDSFNPTISVSGDYAQTNDCPPTLSAALWRVQGCLITVTFTPTSTGPRQSTLSGGPGGPAVTLTGNGVTTPTPWDWPLRLDVGRQGLSLEKKVKFFATTSDDSTLVARGRKIKKTTKQLAAGERTGINAKLKHPKRLNEGPTRGNPKDCWPGRRGCTSIKLNVAVTDEFGQTATDELKVTLCRNPTFALGGPCRPPR